ncbi:protein Mpv17 isoform X1 [Penaeus vannamei]|nr:protein Mpv17-like [Penaeus vannamei]
MSLIRRSYSHLLHKYPMAVQSIQAGVLMGAGDVISQFVIEKKSTSQYEWQRTARFIGLGTFFVGPTLKVWYGILDRRIGSGSTVRALKKVAFDQGIFAPCFLGSFLTVLGVTQGNSPQKIKEEIKNNYVDIILTNWTVWPAVQICNFAFIPLQHQVLIVQIFALFWNTYLAWKTNTGVKEQIKLTEN